MSNTNVHEARMRIGSVMVDVLSDLAVDGEDLTEEEILEVEESMGDVVDLLLQVLEFEII
jgi:hypothetical protein